MELLYTIMERVSQYVNAIDTLITNVEMIAVRVQRLKTIVAHLYSRVLQIEGSIAPPIQITYNIDADTHNTLLHSLNDNTEAFISLYENLLDISQALERLYQEPTRVCDIIVQVRKTHFWGIIRPIIRLY